MPTFEDCRAMLLVVEDAAQANHPALDALMDEATKMIRERYQARRIETDHALNQGTF